MTPFSTTPFPARWVAYPALLALLAAGCAAGDPRPVASAAPSPAATASPALLINTTHTFGLFWSEALEANTLVAAWARARGLRVVDPLHASQVLSAARRGRDPRTGAACGGTLGDWAARERWKETLGAEGVLHVDVSCEEGGACKLHVWAEEGLGWDAKTLAHFVASYEARLPWRVALERALQQLRPDPQERGATGKTGKMFGRLIPYGALGRARPTGLILQSGAAASVDNGADLADAITLTPEGRASLEACLGSHPSAQVLAEVDANGRVGACEARGPDDGAAVCACAALRARASASAAARGKRLYFNAYLRGADVVTPWNALVDARVHTDLVPYRNTVGEPRFPLEVSDPSIEDWSPPLRGEVLKCFADVADGTATFDLPVRVRFDGHGTAVGVWLGEDPAVSTSQRACVLQVFRRSRAPCPAVESSTASAIIRVSIQPVPPAERGSRD